MSSLRLLLMLDGPDFIQSTYSSMKEAIARRGGQRVRDPKVACLDLEAFELHEINLVLDRILTITETVCVTCPYNVPLLIYFCIDNPVSSQGLDLLENLNDLKDTAISVRTIPFILVSRQYLSDAHFSRHDPLPAYIFSNE